MRGKVVPTRSKLTAALFVLLAAFAGARVIAAYLGAGADRLGFFDGIRGFADHVAAFGRAWSTGGFGRIGARGRAPKCAGGLERGLLRGVAQKIFKSHQT